jgi:predicted peroxiredoxin
MPGSVKRPRLTMERTATYAVGSFFRGSLSKYLLIESRDPWESGESRYFYDLAGELAAKGHDVVLYLVQNGVLSVRKGSSSTVVQKAIDARVRVLLDDFSLRERGIDDGERTSGTTISNVSALVDLLAEGRKTLWH